MQTTLFERWERGGGAGGHGHYAEVSIYLSAFEDSVLLHCHTAPFPRIEATISPFRRSLPSPARCRSVTPRSRIFAALVAVRHSAEFHICVMHACSLRKRKWSCQGITRPHGSFADLQPLLLSHEDIFWKMLSLVTPKSLLRFAAANVVCNTGSLECGSPRARASAKGK